MSTSGTDPKERFTSRVDDYVRYRPGYPRAILDYLSESCGLNPLSVVADVGSGTGILTELFLENGNLVYAVEPNDAMRAAAEMRLFDRPKFISIAGSAEETTLPEGSVDIVVAGQAFHWFDARAARREFKRTLKVDGPVVLIWNVRQTEKSDFLREYDELVRGFAVDYERVHHAKVGDDQIGAFYAPNEFATRSFENHQVLDFDGLRGRLISSSYMPGKDHERFAEMVESLRRLFDRHERARRVQMDYQTNVYCGRL